MSWCSTVMVTRQLARHRSMVQSKRRMSSSALFPSIKITADRVTAQGSFAQAQAHFLTPDMTLVHELDSLAETKNLGIVAHFYMDPELQGVLSAMRWPHTFVADSLAMGEEASRMAEKGVTSIAVLGVDFMSESVRANLDSNGFHHVPVYRLRESSIGCSLAEAAERPAYGAYLAKASQTPHSLHVVYINTSLRSKAYSHHTIPTITCTSSNVVQTILQAFVDVPDVKIWYGPDTYMGENLQAMFQHLGSLSDAEIQRIHPQHNRQSLQHVIKHFDYFKEGNCVVHHMFGRAVTERVRKDYVDAYCTAHFEVPGEMFALAMEAQEHDRGVVGSTSNILNFIQQKTLEALEKKNDADMPRLQFILGTEAGMITSIVRGTQSILQQHKGKEDIEVEIIFPVADDAVAKDEELTVVPGVKGGEGCSTSGGCATCPFMKMNDLDALFHVAQSIKLIPSLGQESKKPNVMAKYFPQQYTDVIQGKSVTDLGAVPILHMRDFMTTKVFSSDLVQDITTRKPGQGCPEARR